MVIQTLLFIIIDMTIWKNHFAGGYRGSQMSSSCLTAHRHRNYNSFTFEARTWAFFCMMHFITPLEGKD